MKYSEVLIPYHSDEKGEGRCDGYALLKRAGYIKDSHNSRPLFMELGYRAVKKLEEHIDRLIGENINYIVSREGVRELLVNLASIVNSYKQLPLHIVQKGIAPSLDKGAGTGLFSESPLFAYNYIMLLQRELGHGGKDVVMGLADSLGLNLIKAEGLDREFPKLKCTEYLLEDRDGDREIIFCGSCGYSVQKQLVEAPSYRLRDEEQEKPLEKVITPGAVSVKLLCDFMGCEPKQIVKTMIYVADGKPVAALVRGDRELSLEKLIRILGCSTIEMADRKTVERITGAAVGFAGPVGLNIDIVMDKEVAVMKNFIVGGNQTDYHYKNVNHPRDFKALLVEDIRRADSDTCPACGGKTCLKKGYPLLRVVQLDPEIAGEIKLIYTDKDGQNHPVKGCIMKFNLDRILAAVAQQKGCSEGIQWPSPLKLFDAGIIVINPKKDEQRAVSERVYDSLRDKGVSVFMEDSGRKLGLKFQTMEMMGIDKFIIVGKGAANGKVEFKLKGGGSREIEASNIDELVAGLL